MRLLLALTLILLVSCAKEEQLNFDESITFATDVKTDPATGDTLYAIYLPSGFTPNGDGLNDLYLIYGTGIDENEFRMDIYARNGNFIHTLPDPDQGWNGSVQGHGDYSPSGLYLVKIELKDTTGETHKYSYYASMAR